MNASALLTYLNDHAAGARSALEMLDYLIDSHPGVEDRAFFTTLRADIAADRETLAAIIGRFGEGPSTMRQAGGWFADRMTRLKLALDDPSASGLRSLEALELLALGILGKRSLWRSLAAIQAQVSTLRDLDLVTLQARAEDQYARVEHRRLSTAPAALAA